jgi:hypothetical protein
LAARRIKPSQLLHLPDDPLLFALFGEDPSKTSVIRTTPEGEVEQKEDSRDIARKHGEQNDL